MTKFLLTLFLFTYLLFPFKIFAQEDDKFEANYNINYTVFENGTTAVTQNIALKNKTEEFRSSQFSAEFSFTDIRNISISDSSGPIKPEIEKTDGKTKISFSFNDYVAGKDKVLNFKIYYETGELSKKNGLIWEINIPGIADKTGIGEYNVTLTVPQSFGIPAFVKPAKGDSNLFWTKNEISRGGILVTFGEFQVYKLNLKYHLKNPRLYPVKTQIALPPKTPYQEIFINSITPEPLDVDIDSDGNWLATYVIPPTKTLDISVQAIAKVFLNPQETLGAKIFLTDSERENYLTGDKFWEVDDSNIKQLAGSLGNVQEIYNFAVNNLSYDLKRAEQGLERIGARGILDSKSSAVCMEFTDLFIALARSNGTPAREINGFAYTEDESLRPLSLVRDVLHAWPQYYDSNRQNWIMVDPTWGNTTGGLDYFDALDFNHIVFVVKGFDSEYPIAAGGYKVDNTEGKDVEVSFGTVADISEAKNLKMKLEGTTLVIENLGNTIIHEQTISVKSKDLKPNNQQLRLFNIPPRGKEIFTIKPSFVSIFPGKKAIIEVETDGYKNKFEVIVSPFYILNSKLLVILGGGIGGILAITLLIKFTRRSWRLYLQRQQGTSTLRGQGEQPQEKSSNTPRR